MMLSEPAWLLDLLAAVMLVVAAYCVARLAVARRLHRALRYDVNAARAAEGAAMAGMLAPALNLLSDAAWEVVFVGLAALFAWRSLSFIARHGLTHPSSDHAHGVSHYVTHLVMSCAMLYMYFAGVTVTSTQVTGMSMGPAPGTADFVALPLLFIVVLAGSAVWHLDALSRFARVRVSDPAPGRAASSDAAASSDGAASPGGVATAVMTATGGPSEAGWLAPRLEMGCHIAICVAMAFMLVLML